jgi:hypothetical protein
MLLLMYASYWLTVCTCVCAQVKQAVSMATGGPRGAYLNEAKLAKVLTYEVQRNNRFEAVQSGEEPPPWVADQAALSQRREYASSLAAKGFLPRCLSHIDFHKALSGNCKSSVWVALAGPVGKVLLEGLFPDEQIEAVMMEYLDLISAIWEHRIDVRDADLLVTRMRECLVKMEIFFPGYELNINRHNMAHMVEGIRRFGPGHAWSMFPDERCWNFLTKMLKNVARPAASILQRWKLLVIAFQAAQDWKEWYGGVSTRLTIDVMQNEGGQLRYLQHTDFQDDTFRMRVYKEVKRGAINMDTRVTEDAPGEPGYAFKVQAHLCFLSHPWMCKGCTHVEKPGPEHMCDKEGCRTYKDLWDTYTHYKQDMNEWHGDPKTVADWADLLSKWERWAKLANLPKHEVDICKGPQGKMRRYKCAEVCHVSFSTYSHCRHNTKSKPCVIMMKHAVGVDPDAVVGQDADAEIASFGQVENFLLLLAPGSLHLGTVEQDHVWACHLVQCSWYKPFGRGAETLDPVTHLHLVRSPPSQYHVDGDVWPLSAVSPVEVGLVPHRNKPNCMVAVGARSSFAGRKLT